MNSSATRENATREKDESIATTVADMPANVRATLDGLGINGEAVLEAQSDLDEQGRWSDRYLIITTQRVIVLSDSRALDGDSQTSNATSSTRTSTRSANIEFDAPLANIISSEAKSFVGSSALEARVRVEGSFLNGHSPSAPTTERVVE